MKARHIALYAIAWLPGLVALVCIAIAYPFFQATCWLCERAERGQL